MAAVSSAATIAEKDSTRPLYHFRPPAQWMSDICGAFFHKGYHHAFYQFNPYGDRPGDGTGWGHARSRDCVHWEFLPPALLPSEETGDRADASGSAFIRSDGVPMLFFTHTPIDYPEHKREAWAALPADDECLKWNRVDIGLAAGRSGIPDSIHERWADMFVFRHGKRVFATFKQSDGMVCEAQNRELTSWRAVGNLGGSDTDVTLATGTVGGECPNLFTLDARQVLIRSTYPISYLIGSFNPDDITFEPDDVDPQVLDFGYGGESAPDHYTRGLYGTTVYVDDTGRTILLGWVSGFKANRGWNGCMSLPRVLTIDNNRLMQSPHPALEKLRGERTHFEGLKVPIGMSRMHGVRGKMLEIIAELVPEGATRFGLIVRGSTDGERGLRITYSNGVLNVAGTDVPLDLSINESLKLHLFLDNCAMELFVQGGTPSVTRFDYSPEHHLDVFAFAEGGDMVVRTLDAWELGSIYS